MNAATRPVQRFSPSWLAAWATVVALVHSATGCGRVELTQVDDTTLAAATDGAADHSSRGVSKRPVELKAGETAASTRDKPDSAPPPDPRNRPDERPDAEPPSAEPPPMADDFPFTHRYKAPSLDGGVGWINAAGPIDLGDLKGKFVVLDFWTYCCINCMHVLPELAKLEQAYPNNVVVIGVHSAKFETEKDTKNITEAVMRHEIAHPVLNDANMVVWEKYGATGWPAVRIIDPEGYVIAADGGEIPFKAFDEFLKKAIPVYRKRRSLDETPLKFPGKILADEKSGRLFIADSNHNRIVIADLGGKLQAVIGSGASGKRDGSFADATFNHPQGMVLAGDVLYVADTENHLLRTVDLVRQRVATIAGTGAQASSPWPGLEKLRRGLLGDEDEWPQRWVGKPLETPLNSPWDLWVHRADLYVAMAGPHQIWKMPLNESEIGPYAGNGREDVVDGPLLPKRPYATGYASFAQPSGLASDGERLFVADSEGSSIRAVPFDPAKEVETVVGTSHLPAARLFTFGDQDGEDNEVRLQHALGVVYVDGQLYVADTYNNKIKVVDPHRRSAKTIAGDGKAGATDAPPTFDEPAGISYARGKLYVADTNNHLVRTVDVKSPHRVATLSIEGLRPPAALQGDSKPSFEGATRIEAGKVVAAPDEKGRIVLEVSLALPPGWKLNPLAPTSYFVEAEGEDGPLLRSALGKRAVVARPGRQFQIPLAVSAAREGTGAGDQTETLRVFVEYFYCQEKPGGLCRIGRALWTLTLSLGEGKFQPVPLFLEVQ